MSKEKIKEKNIVLAEKCIHGIQESTMKFFQIIRQMQTTKC